MPSEPRRPVTGPRGVVSAGDPLAAAAAVRALRAGGNAVDGVLAAALVQCVVEFPWCGLGGDAFLLVDTPGGRPRAINGSGVAPAGIEAAVGGPGARAPRFGPLSVAVPGFVAAWWLAATTAGSLPPAVLAEAAVELAVDGFPADAGLVAAVGRLSARSARSGAVSAGGAGARAMFAAIPGLVAAAPGDVLRLPDLGATIAAVAADGPDAFYRGPVGARIADQLAARGGVLDRVDLAAHEASWTDPLTIDYRGRRVVTHPPVSLGAALLAELRVAEGFELAGYPLGGADLTDLLVRCKLAAFAELPHLGDTADVAEVVAALLSDERAASWRAAIRRDGRVPAGPVAAVGGGLDTTSVAVADSAGTTAVLIHSLFNEFGARELVGGTGVLLNDRLANLVVDPAVPNGLRAGRRPIHTLNAYLVQEDVRGRSVVTAAGATPGGRGQVQTNLQVLTHLIDFGLGAQDAVDRPRWLSGTPRTANPDDILYLEHGFDPETAAELRRRGHAVRVIPPAGAEHDLGPDLDADDLFGACTVVTRDPATGAVAAAADHRRRVHALGC